jgi:hypothetical protein
MDFSEQYQLDGEAWDIRYAKHIDDRMFIVDL